MEKLLSFGNYIPILEEGSPLPTQGRYHALITAVETIEIMPLGQDMEFCLIVRFRLVNTETFDVFDFTETFLPYKGNTRAEDFLSFLNCYGYDFTSDDNIVGLKATVEVIYTSLGGYVHPEISFRPWGLAQAIQGCSDETLPF